MKRLTCTTFKWLFWSWLIIIFVSSSIPYLGGGGLSIRIPITEIDIELRSDYFLHSFMYFVLVTFFILWKKHWIKNHFLVSLISIIVVSVGISFLAEYSQSIIPGRAYNINDFLFNIIGIGIGIVFSIIIIESPGGKKSK